MQVFDLGLKDYHSFWEFQKDTFLQVKLGKIRSALIFCRHQPVITLGRSSKQENVLVDQSRLDELRIKSYKIERGGDVTYHGLGQLCVYPIINLSYLKKDINWFLRSLESLLIGLLADFGIKAGIIPKNTGIWIDQSKIASIGISIRNWITFHGLSLNVSDADIGNFSLIRPCGQDIMMVSMERILGKKVKFEDVKERLKRRWHETSSFAGVR